jgi:hypothetical protein
MEGSSGELCAMGETLTSRSHMGDEGYDGRKVYFIGEEE